MKVLIVISILVASLLTTIPIGYEWHWFRPEFLVLLIIYWSIYTPQLFGLSAAWLVGLLMDLLYLSPLGFNILGALLISYISHRVYQRIRNYVLWQQAIWVFVLIGVFQLFSNWLGNFFAQTAVSPIFLISAFLSCLLWPVLVLIFERVKVTFRLNN